MRAKICGITRLQDAMLAIQQGAWAIGFNFYNQSKRYISYQEAKNIIRKLPKKIIKIGIFIDTPSENILNYLDAIGLDYAQIYQLNASHIQYNYKFILTLNLASESELLLSHTTLNSYYSLMLDAPLSTDLLLGGTGRLANWTLAKKLARDHRLILAGGLNSENVQQAIDYVNPYAVDVASGIESSPGIKHPILLKKFLSGARHDSI